MKQNNLLRVYMKLEQHSYSGQMGFRNMEEGEGEGASSKVGMKRRGKLKISVLDIFLQTTVQSKLSDPVFPNTCALTECIFSSYMFCCFYNTAYQNGRIKWRKV